MFKTHTMKKVHLFILNKDVKKVSNVLYDLKLMEFFSIKKEKFDNYESEKLHEESAKILSLRSGITLLKNYHKNNIESGSDDKALEKAKALNEDLSKLDKEILHLKDEINRQEILVHLKLSKEQINDKNSTIGFIPLEAESRLSTLKSKVKKYKDKRNKRLYFYVNSKDISFNYKEFYLPSKVNVSLSSDLKIKEQKKQKIISNLEDLANKNLFSLQQEELKLSKLISIHEAKSHFKKTENFTVLSGYIPEIKVKKLKRNVEKEIGNKFDIIEEEADEDAPISFANGPLTSNFESLLKLYSMPKYGEIDPTFLMLIAFPLFYGFILGDFGYGLVTFIAFTLAKLKWTELKAFFSILQISSVSSMIWGIIYGEYFGFEPYYLFTRAYMPETLLIVAIIFGIIHINLGLMVGYLNKAKKSVKAGIYDHLSWIVFQIGLGLAVFGMISSITLLTYLGWSIFVGSLVLIYLGHGFLGLIEIPSFFTNIMSYARLMAVGLSSVLIAILINDYTMVFFDKGIFGIIIGIIIFTVGHIFNIILGNFESFLQALRLHYVEFFTKFYEGGGKEFEPFGSKIHNMKEEN